MSRRAVSAPFHGKSSSLSRLAVFLLAALATLMPVALRAESAASLYKAGQAAEAREDYDTAFEDYQKAFAKQPKDLRFKTAMLRVRQTASSQHLSRGRRLLQQGDINGALTECLRSSEIDPGNEAAVQEIALIRAKMPATEPRAETSVSSPEDNDLQSAAGPATLKPLSNEPLTLHMSQDVKVVYESIGKEAGINVLFDPDYNSKHIQVDLVNVSLSDALRIVATESGTFWRTITDNTIFVAANTRAKRSELDELAVQTFYLSNAWQQNDLNDVQTAIRNVLPNTKVFGVPSQNAIVMRATPDELLLAQKIINDLDKARPEVVVDVAVLEVSKNWERTIGLAWPSSIGFGLQQTAAESSASSSSSSSSTTSTTTSTTGGLTLNNLANLNANNFSVTVSSATANLLLTDSNTKILQNPRIRATDSQKATMKIGSRIPIATGSFQSGAATAAVSSLVNTQFQYLDVGVNVEMTPTVHYDHDVTLKMKIEVTSQSGSTTISDVTEPIISQRTVEQVIRLREGEASILGGILNQQDNQSWSGIPGLGQIPILKYLFGSKDHTITDDEIVFVLVPRIVRSQELTPLNLRQIDTGSGQTIDLRRVSTDDGGNPAAAPTMAPKPMSRPAAPTRRPAPGTLPGTLPGQTAQAAAAEGIAELRRDGQPLPTLTTPPPSAAKAQAAIAPPSVAQAATSAAMTLTPLMSTQAVGSTFSLSILLQNGTDVAAVPIQVQYDPQKLSLQNVDSGDFLGKDGQAAALVHRDDGPGMINIAASRPPGAKGVSGSGAICVLTFQAKAAGETIVSVVKAGTQNSAQQTAPAQGSNAKVTIH